MIGEESPSSRQGSKKADSNKPASFVEAIKKVEEEQVGKASWFQLSKIKDNNFLEEWETLDLLLPKLEDKAFNKSELNPYANQIDPDNGS